MIMARETAPLFNIRLNSVECDAQYLSPDGIFEEIPHTLISSAASCILTTKSFEYKFIEASTSYLTRFSFVIAVWQDNLWRLRFRGVITNKHGLLLFKEHSTLNMVDGRYVVPDAKKNNTIVIIGLKSKHNAMSILFNIFANSAGNPTDDVLNFNGYSGEITWRMMTEGGERKEVITIPKSLDGYLKKEEVQYNRRIFYKKSTPLSSFQEQR